MAEFVLLWKLSPLENHSQWLCIWPDCRTQRAPDFDSLWKIDEVTKIPTIYTNFPVNAQYQQRLNEVQVCELDLTPFEYQYLFHLIGAYIPDLDDQSSVLSTEKLHRTESKLKPLMMWLGRYHYHLKRFGTHFEEIINKQTKPPDSFIKMANWLSRRSCRIYPEGAVMNKHVYTSRWGPTHWGDMLKSGFAHTPKRDAGMLKACRTESHRVLLIEQAAFVLVNFSKTSADLDYPIKQSVWVSNAELNAICKLDSKTKFEVQDLLVFPLESPEPSELLDDELFELSLTHGIAARNIVSQFSGTWTMAWWRSVERANWISLIAEMKLKFQVVISGYGDGYLSFFCWEGEMARLTEMLRVRAAVLKQSDHEFDAEFHQEYRALLQQRLDGTKQSTKSSELMNEITPNQTTGL